MISGEAHFLTAYRQPLQCEIDGVMPSGPRSVSNRSLRRAICLRRKNTMPGKELG